MEETDGARKEPKMRSGGKAGVVLCVILIAAGAQIAAQTEWSDSIGVEERLVSFAGELSLAISVASFGIYAPTLADLRLHAQQLVNLLEGSGGRHYVRPAEAVAPSAGLLGELVVLTDGLAGRAVEPEPRARIAAATENVSTYLNFALESTLASLKRRRLDDAVADLMRTYAYLGAALERPLEASAVPGWWMILRLFELSDVVDASP